MAYTPAQIEPTLSLRPEPIGDDLAFFGHPRGLGWLSYAEFWERFSYYGMQALLVLYMTHRLLQPGHVEHVFGFAVFRTALEAVYGPLSAQALASVTFGLYAGLVYVTPIAGGLLADRVLGRTRTVVLGASLMAAGHFLMASEYTFLLALLCLLLGAGCFKGNLAAQVGTLYAPGDSRSTDGFQIYYLAINVAVLASPLVCGTLGERYGYHWGFGAAGAGMVIGLVVYLKGRAWLPRESALDRNTQNKSRQLLLPSERRRLIVMVALLPILGAALVGNFQVFNAYLLWAETNFDLQVFGFAMPVTWLLSLGSVIVLASIAGTVLFWRWWARHRAEPSALTKMTLGAFLLACAPLAPALCSYVVATTGHKASLAWAVAYEILNDIGYANLLPVGLALYARAAPKSVGGMVTGVYYVLLFFTNMLVGWLGGFLERMSGVQFWLLHVAVVGSAALVLLAVRGPVARILVPAEEAIVPVAAPRGSEAVSVL
jgi:POT family proton-dependent oligopeptide transporter